MKIFVGLLGLFVVLWLSAVIAAWIVLVLNRRRRSRQQQADQVVAMDAERLQAVRSLAAADYAKFTQHRRNGRSR